eukprot:760722-Hanusia_phi.AAC.3
MSVTERSSPWQLAATCCRGPRCRGERRRCDGAQKLKENGRNTVPNRVPSCFGKGQRIGGKEEAIRSPGRWKKKDQLKVDRWDSEISSLICDERSFFTWKMAVDTALDAVRVIFRAQFLFCPGQRAHRPHALPNHASRCRGECWGAISDEDDQRHLVGRDSLLEKDAVASDAGFSLAGSDHGARGVGQGLPFLMIYCGQDPVHSGAAVQVLMDLWGVVVSCIVCSIILGATKHQVNGEFILN